MQTAALVSGTQSSSLGATAGMMNLDDEPLLLIVLSLVAPGGAAEAFPDRKLPRRGILPVAAVVVEVGGGELVRDV
jgi:hypothetical protein